MFLHPERRFDIAAPYLEPPPTCSSATCAEHHPRYRDAAASALSGFLPELRPPWARA